MPQPSDISTLDLVGDTSLEHRTLSRVRRHLFAYFIFGMIFVQLDKTSIGFAQLTMGKELGLSATVFGFAAGIFSLASFLVQVPASMLFKRLGARRWLTVTTIVWGFVCITQAFVAHGGQLIVLRFLLGVFEAGFLPGMFILVGIWFRGNNHGVAVSCIQIGTAAAGIIGGPIAGWILGCALFGLSGWRSLFLLEGTLTLIFALIALFVVSDDPGSALWLNRDEQRFITGYLAAHEVEKTTHGVIDRPRFLDALRDRRILMLTVSYACTGWAAGTFTFFTPTLLKAASHGLDVRTVGLLSAVPYSVNAIVAFLGGVHADRHNERHWHTVLPIVVAILGILLYPAAKSAVIALVALVLVHAGNTGVYVNFWATCTMVVGRRTLTQSTAIINSGSAAATFIAPIVFGWAMDATHSSAVGVYECGAVLMLNFVILNVFFFGLKSRQIAESPV